MIALRCTIQSLLGVHVEGLTLDMDKVKTYLNLPPITQLYGELLGVINHPPRMLAAILQVCDLSFPLIWPFFFCSWLMA